MLVHHVAIYVKSLHDKKTTLLNNFALSRYHPYIYHGQLYRNKTRREPTIQFIVDTINDEEDEADYCKDLVEDLIDAYALQEKKTKQRQQIRTPKEP